jgi:tetratricopeptide (TPR) repeat protein
MKQKLLLTFFLFLSLSSLFAQATAILESDTAFAKQFDIKEYFNVEITPEQRSQYKSEIEKLTVIIAAHPNETSAYINRGAYFSYLGFHVNAIKDYDEALKINKNIPEALYNRGVAKARYFYTIDSCKDIYASAQLGLEFAKVSFDRNCKRYANFIVSK